MTHTQPIILETIGAHTAGEPLRVITMPVGFAAVVAAVIPQQNNALGAHVSR